MKFSIYYNSKELAGAENLYIRISKKLIQEGHKVYIYDNQKRLISKESPGSIPMNYGDYLKSVDVLIYSMSDILNQNLNLNLGEVNKKTIIWNLHPDNIYGIMKFGGIVKKLKKFQWLATTIIKIINFNKLRKIYNILKGENVVIAFMDKQNQDNFFRLINGNFKTALVPIVHEEIDSSNILKSRLFKKNDDESINILFVGRLVSFKIVPLLNFIERLKKINITINLTIVGDGPLKNKIEKRKFPEHININLVGNKYGDNLDYYISKNDIAFAMGTAALDLAQRGLPVLLSPIGEEHPGECCWLYQSNGYNTAFTADSPKLTLDQIVENIFVDSDYVAKLCQDYVFRNHSSNITYTKIISQL